MQKPIAADRFDAALCMVPPRQRTDQAGRPRKDADGVVQWLVTVAVTATKGNRIESETIDIVVPGEPQGITVGMPVTITDLWHNDWTIDGRSGATWSAADITPATPSTPPTSAPTARGSKGGDG
ncbi:hypothetical protein ACFOSC_16415 [Streptantibioticus rubrisoli]|uniref:Uncharacterized protein n=1 Tax=Streptantibioticus rubrisoli TaxID=1387313 RepID=A0ABT1PAP7_9ACTN|nr:hypothetical protein [Streptantibioticus rubrisoli]MCQ4042452.1 hypothetical protein [Streptantibioticus rubrisoli]